MPQDSPVFRSSRGRRGDPGRAGPETVGRGGSPGSNTAVGLGGGGCKLTLGCGEQRSLVGQNCVVMEGVRHENGRRGHGDSEQDFLADILP